MGDGFELRFPSNNMLGLPDPDGSALLGGTRFSPGARLNLGDFFAEFRVEGAFTNAQRTTIGSNLFDSTPSSSLARQSPMSLWEYEPSDDNDRLRANFGIRSATIGYRLAQDFNFRIGPHRYDITEAERLCMDNTFAPSCKFSFFSFPIGFIGGEFRYDRRRDTETVRQLMFSLSGMNTGFGGGFGMVQGLATFALEPGATAPRFTLHAFAGLHSNPQPEEGHLVDPGLTHGEGVGLQFDYSLFTGGFTYAHRDGHSLDEAGVGEDHRRDVLTTYLQVRPGDFLVRGTFSFLSRTDREGISVDPPTGMTEPHTELFGGWRPIDGLLLGLGYHGVYGERPAHVAFIGVSTDLRLNLPFGGSH